MPNTHTHTRTRTHLDRRLPEHRRPPPCKPRPPSLRPESPFSAPAPARLFVCRPSRCPALLVRKPPQSPRLRSRPRVCRRLRRLRRGAPVMAAHCAAPEPLLMAGDGVRLADAETQATAIATQATACKA